MTRRATAVLVLMLAGLLLAACGSSSPSKSSSSAAGSPARTGQGASRFAALRECMKKSGVTLPAPSTRKPGQGGPPSGGGFPLGGGRARQLPKGVTQARFQAALRRCGGGSALRGRGGFGRLGSPTYRKALVKFAACMREGGVNVPAPNTSGSGPVFNTKGLNVTSAKFKAAQAKCSSLLRVAPGTPGGGAAPPG